MLDFDTNTIISIIAIVISLTISLAYLLNIVKNKSRERLKERYDFDKMRVELDYMRKNIEHQQYEISKKLEENNSRWKDINHLVLSSQNKMNDFNQKKNFDNQNNFLNKFNLQNTEIDNKLVFVLTPFNNEYTESFETIRNTCSEIGLRCIRGDEEYIEGDLLPNIIQNIVKAKFVIANITGRNPNVFYELGIAHTLNKPTILIAKNLSDAPFDIQSKYLVLFKNMDDLSDSIKQMLTKIILANN